MAVVTSANRTMKSRTAQSYLRAVVDEIDMDDVRAVARTVIEKALKGDAKAIDWIGKYVLGNGRISLIDLSSPSILARKP